MAVFFNNHFETGDFTGWTAQVGTPTVEAGAPVFQGPYAMESYTNVGSEYTRYNSGTGPAVGVFRFMFRVVDVGAANQNQWICVFERPDQAQNMQIRMVTDAGSNMTLQARQSALISANTVAISIGTWYRIEGKLDWSATNWKLTWGWAVGDAALTTVETDATFGNTLAASTVDYWYFGQSGGGGENRRQRHDSIKLANTAGDYPLGPVIVGGAASGSRMLMGVG